MKTSPDRILTTHTGSLPRPPSLADRHDGQAVRDAVRESVTKQLAAGVDIINDGEMSKAGFATYVIVKLPDGKILIPGVVDSTTNYIEHPELVAQRICRYAGVVGRDNVIAGTDCGFGTFASQVIVEPEIAWAKLATMAEGAQLASSRLWGHPR